MSAPNPELVKELMELKASSNGIDRASIRNMLNGAIQLIAMDEQKGTVQYSQSAAILMLENAYFHSKVSRGDLEAFTRCISTVMTLYRESIAVPASRSSVTYVLQHCNYGTPF